jgi:hypothetical protein
MMHALLLCDRYWLNVGSRIRMEGFVDPMLHMLASYLMRQFRVAHSDDEEENGERDGCRIIISPFVRVFICGVV